ncbi:hypothetical protein SH668x_000504 [Planctomicrobium sp. SH668]|uniref:hypothetical protein n=1 Tax=Planctomicrobium sp. SH668 TaxID=3448126 RepID=UPI003F5B35A2
MKWSLFAIACAALFLNNGCCGRQCSPCGGGYSSYGSTYGSSYAPSYAPNSCPGGGCGPMYQSGALTPIPQQANVSGVQQTTMMTGNPQTAFVPNGVVAPQSTASLDYLPAY